MGMSATEFNERYGFYAQRSVPAAGRTVGRTMGTGQSFGMVVDLAGFEAGIDAMADVLEEAARPAAQSAAQVLYDAVRLNVFALGSKTGLLLDSIYQVYSKANSSPGQATYYVSWNVKKAPHGHLVEFGHLQRYKVYTGKDGKWYTAVRPEKKGTPKPGRYATQAQKDAYYVPLAVPRQVAAQSFIRKAMSAFPAAEAAAEQKLLELIT